MVTLNHLLLRRAPMDVVADSGSAKLWLGGRAACLDAKKLLENHIQPTGAQQEPSKSPGGAQL